MAKFSCLTASSTANYGMFRFNVDGTNMFDIADQGITTYGGINEQVDYNGTTFENTLTGHGSYQGGKVLKYSPGADESPTAGELYFLHTDGTWNHTQADDVATGGSQLLGVGLGAAARTTGVLLEGYVRIPVESISDPIDSGAVDGLPLYVCDANAGHLRFAAPDTQNDFVRIVGYAIDNHAEDDGGDVLVYFNPSKTWVKIA